MGLRRSASLVAAIIAVAFLCANAGIGVDCADATNGQVEDLFRPLIGSVTQSVDFPGQGEDVTITAHVTDNIGVDSVTLTYDTTIVPMTLDTGNDKDGYWKATIPGQPAGTRRGSPRG